MNKITEIYQALIKVFVRSNKRFPAGKELQDLERQAREVFDGALSYNLDQAKGKNLDDITVMEQTTEKSGDQLIDDYLSNEANKGRLTSEPTFTQVDERTLPRAEIEALPLKDKEKAEAAVKKKLEAQNVQAKQSRQGGETPGGPQRGRPEAVDDNFRDTIYIDKSEMQKLTDQAWKYFDAAESAMSQGKFDEARAILKYEIADNYQFPANIREAADDARNMIDRDGLAWKDMGYESYDEGLEAFNEKISKGQQQTMEDNWVDFTDPLEPEKQKSQRIEYVSFFDEPGEDFGTPNDSISDISKLFYNYKKGGPVKKKKPVIDPKDKGPFDDIFKKMFSEYEWEKKKKSYKDGFATGGRVGFSNGGIKGKLIELINKISKSRKVKKPEAENFAQLLDDIEQAKKAGIIDEAGFKSFQRGIDSMRDAVYGRRMTYPTGVPGGKSALPVDDKDLVPKTNLGLIRTKIKKDKEGIQSLADDNAIPVRDDTNWIDSERERLTGLIKQLKTPMLRNDRIDDLKLLDYVEETGATKAEYDEMRMAKYKNLPSKAAYRRDPEAAERSANKSMAANKTKIKTTYLNADEVRALGKKEGISAEEVEKFIASENGIMKRGQARGVVRKDKDGKMYIKDKFSSKYVSAPITADEETARKLAEFMKENDPEGYDAISKIVDEINQKRELKDFKTKGRKPNAEGGLNYLMGF